MVCLFVETRSYFVSLALTHRDSLASESQVGLGQMIEGSRSSGLCLPVLKFKKGTTMTGSIPRFKANGYYLPKKLETRAQSIFYTPRAFVNLTPENTLSSQASSYKSKQFPCKLKTVTQEGR